MLGSAKKLQPLTAAWAARLFGAAALDRAAGIWRAAGLCSTAGFCSNLLPRLCAVLVGAGLLAAHMPGEAAAQEIMWSNRKATPRLQSLVVPLRYKRFHLGDVQTRIHPSGAISVQKTHLVKSLEGALKKPAWRALNELAAAENGYITLRRLRAGGFNIRFDSAQVALIVHLTLDQLARRDLSLTRRRSTLKSARAAKPAKFSGYINLFSAVDYVSLSRNEGDEGFTNPRFDMVGALRLFDLVLEAEATVETGDETFGDRGAGFKRRGTRLVKDFVENSIRVKAGDVDPLFTSFQTGQDLLGITIEHNVRTFHPGRNIRPTSRRSFRLERDSTVEIYVNGRLTRSRRLAAGDYNVNDLPGTAGANVIRLVVRDDVGEERVLEFTTFLDRRLLSPDVSEWAISGGVIAFTKDGEPDYTNNPVVSAYYRQGINELMTGEIHIQGDEGVVMGGAGLLYGSPVGLVNIELATSYMQEFGLGYAFNFDLEMSRHLLNWDEANRSFRFSAEYRSDSFGGVSDDDPKNDTALTLSLGYGQLLFWDTSLSLSANYTMGRGTEGDTYGASLGLSRRFGPYITAGISLSYNFDEAPPSGRDEDEFNALFRLSYKIDDKSTLAGYYDLAEGSARVSYHRHEGKGTGSWAVAVNAEYDAAENDDDPATPPVDDDGYVNGSFTYVANRAIFSLSHSAQFAGLGTDIEENRTSLRMETAIAFADGAIAIGRPVSGGFAIVSPHESIAGKAIIVNPSEDGELTHSDIFSTVLVPNISPYTASRVTFDVDDLPVGYDLGTGAFDFWAPYRAGYSLTVGSNYTVTAFGRMVDRRGEPVALLTGDAWQTSNPDRKVTIFTNRVGRFGAQGLAPGEWVIEMATVPATRYRLIVPEGTVGLFRAGTLRPVR